MRQAERDVRSGNPFKLDELAAARDQFAHVLNGTNQSQGDTRSGQLAGEMPDGTFSGNFVLITGREDSAGDEGDHLNSAARQEHMFRSLIFGEDSTIALRPLVVTGLDTGIGGDILFADFRDNNIRDIQLQVILTGDATFANVLGATDTAVTTAVFLVGVGETAAGLAAVGALVRGGLRALPSLSRVTKKISNPVPDTVARVIPGTKARSTLGRMNADDVFVTGADDIAGLNAKQIAERLTIRDSKSFTIIEFPTPKNGIASPVLRNDPGFIGKGRTAGGAREFVIPNQGIPKDAQIRIAK